MARARDTLVDLLIHDGHTDDDDAIELQELQELTRPRITSFHLTDRPRSNIGRHHLSLAFQRLANLALPSSASPSGSSSAAANATATAATSSAQAPAPRPSSAMPRRPSSRHTHPHGTRRGTGAAANPPVIDLTEEPDSPPQPPRQPSRPRHPRRTESQRVSPPRLSRSDSTVVGGQQDASVIDLTSDSPERARRPSSSNPDPIFVRSQRRQAHRTTTQDELIDMEMLAPDFQFTRRLSHFLDNAGLYRHFPPVIQHTMPQTRRVHVPTVPPSPKPPLEPVPPAREGFTRDTHGNEDSDTVVVCPSCNEELAYDPAESATQGSSKKRKRPRGEHHFWALKKCGHVYCADCFEGRKPSKSSTRSGFRKAASSTSSSQDIHCAVDGCETKAGSKSEWIGIFL